jgi:hypothetical protein
MEPVRGLNCSGFATFSWRRKTVARNTAAWAARRFVPRGVRIPALFGYPDIN